MAQQAHGRIEHLDTTKGLLALGMVLAHVIQFFAIPTYWLDVISLWGNLVSFSGFLFCFGYVSYGAYLHRDPIPRVRMASNGVKLLIAFYLSGLTYNYVIAGHTDLADLAPILLLMDIPGYSEFLPAFALIIFISALVGPLVNNLIENEQRLLLATAFCLACCFMPYSLITFPPLGLLLGTETFASFSVLQYFPLFLIGGYFAHRHFDAVSKPYLLLAVALLLCFGAYKMLTGEFPTRFPPSLVWVASSFGAVYISYAVSIAIDDTPHLAPWLRGIGRNVLFWLIASNLLIFLLVPVLGKKNYTPLDTFIVYGLMILTIMFMQTLIRPINRAG